MDDSPVEEYRDKMTDWGYHYLSILNNVKPASHHKVALGLTLLRIPSRVDKPINTGIHVQNVGTQFSGIRVL